MPVWTGSRMTKSRRQLSPALKESIATAARYELARRHYADYVQLVHAGRWKRARHLDLVCRELENIMAGKELTKFGFLKKKEMNRRVQELKKEGLCASVYTQLSDIEEETNGIMTYDRRVLKL